MSFAPALARIFLGMAAAVSLAACNVVVTKAPLLSPNDEAGAPPLRPGLWRFDTDADCRFDDKAPYVNWPACSGGAFLNAGDAAFYDRKSGKTALQHQAFVLAAGAPRIFQARVAIGGDFSTDSPPYVYAGGRATKVDDQGRIVAFAFWPVQCGPPPPASAGGEKLGAGGTLHPLAGLIMQPGEPVCSTDSVPALRAAAKASEAWAEKIPQARWLRDGDP